jgi:hypothetical protein
MAFRGNRLKAGTIVAALGLALTVFGGTSTAQASTHPQVDKKPARTMITKLHQHPLQIRVRVMGGYAHGATFLQRKDCAHCNWRKVGHKATDANGRVLYPLDAPSTGNWYYRVATPERPQYRESHSRVIKTYRI